MTALQYFILGFTLFVLWRIVVKYRARSISWREWLGWTLFWLAVGIATALPQSTDLLARTVGLSTGRGVDLAVYISVPVLFYLVFKIIAKIDKVDKQLTELTRQQALSRPESPSDDHRPNSPRQ